MERKYRVHWRGKTRVWFTVSAVGFRFQAIQTVRGTPPLLSGLRVQGLSGFEGGLYMAISVLQRQRKAKDAVQGVDHSKFSRV